MEFNIKESDKTKLVLNVKGEDHTFCNIIVKRLQKNPDVRVASYRIDHPLERIPTILVETKQGTTPKQALLEAVKEVEKEVKEFDKKFSKI